MKISAKITKTNAENFDEKFIEMMRCRVVVGFERYGSAREHYSISPGTAIQDAELRLQKYRDTGNTEWLVDAANFLMFEFMYPGHQDAHFRVTSHNESPGAIGLSPRELEELNRENGL